MEEASDTFLRGPRIFLRPMEREDLPRFRELFSDSKGNLSDGGIGIPDSLTKLQRRYEAEEFDITDRNLHLVIESEGGIFGQVTLKNEENLPSRAANFGILIGAGFIGRGYGTEASKILLDYAFGVLGYHKITPDLFEYNARARKMYEKIGFLHEGRRRENHWSWGRFWDDIRMGITAGEWWAKHGPPPQPETGQGGL